MERIKDVIASALPGIEFEPMVNIAHNYAAIEHHFGHDVIVHRKGATLTRESIVHAIRTEKDLEKAAGAYKDIETVINNELTSLRSRHVS